VFILGMVEIPRFQWKINVFNVPARKTGPKIVRFSDRI